MEKKRITTKERGKIAGLSVLAVVSGAGIALSLIAYFGSDFNFGALIAFMISFGVFAWAIIKASKMQKVIDARTYGVQPEPVPAAANNPITGGRACPKCCGHSITYQTVTESRKAGCFTVILYIILACTIFGLLIVILLMLRKKTETVTYAVCQNCGNRWRIK